MQNFLPDQYRKMREISRWQEDPKGGAGRWLSEAELFYRQGLLMADFEDDCPYNGTFKSYFPTYNAMSDRQLRGYFTWRAQVRRGTVEETSTSFAFLYLYELICGIGVDDPLYGFNKIKAFWDAYRAFEPRLAACINLSRSGPMGVPFPVFYLCLESSQDRFFPPASAFILPGRRHHPVSDERNFVPSNDVCGGRLPHRPFRANEGERHFFPPRPALEKIMKFFPPRGWIPQGRIMLTHSFSFLFFLMSDFLPYGKRQKNMPIIL